uniref:SCP2 domain-containing protein n=1 Tax=Ficedula albicollis TaxID=59894 RepID=A0A803VDD2_FICAL
MQHPPGASSRPRSCPQETVERPPLPGATPLVWVLCPWSFPVAQGPRCPALSALPALPALLRLRAAWAGLGWLLPAEGAGKCSLGKAVASQVLVSAVSWPRVSWRRGDGLSGQQSALKAPCVLHGTAPTHLLPHFKPFLLVSMNEEYVRSTQGVFQFELSGDGGGTWYIDLKSKGGSAGFGKPPVTADVVMSMSSADFVKMFTGEGQRPLPRDAGTGPGKASAAGAVERLLAL